METQNKRLRYGNFAVILSAIYAMTAMFSQVVSQSGTAIVGFIFVFFLFFIRRKMGMSMDETLFMLTLCSINTSFTSILGGDYSKFPITWFMLSSLVLFVRILYIGIKKSAVFGLFFLWIAFFSISLIGKESFDYMEAVKQFINLDLFLLSILVGENLNFSKDRVDYFKKIYTDSTLIFALLICIQAFIYNLSGVFYGTGDTYSTRVTFAASFTDYSFASLYIASGIVLLVVQIMEREISINQMQILLKLAILFAGMILGNARTGVAAMIVVVFFYLFRKILQGNKYAITLCLISIPVAAFVINQQVESRGGQNFLDSSGRFDNYMTGLKVFLENPIMGVGFGIDNYTQNLVNVIEAIPHNMIIQFLAQFGMIGTTLLLVMLFEPFRIALAGKTPQAWALLAVFAGAMLIPDIASSHYAGVLIVISMAGYKNNKFIKPNPLKTTT